MGGIAGPITDIDRLNKLERTRWDRPYLESLEARKLFGDVRRLGMTILAHAGRSASLIYQNDRSTAARTGLALNKPRTFRFELRA